MNILVIFTGGTIGSTLDNGVISTNDSSKKMLIDMYQNKYSSTSIFDELTPFTMLSENLSALELNLIIKNVKDNADKYDGIIITHGTDTLQYTASALSLALGDIDIPVLLVSSAYPLENPMANGVDNFAGAVKFIENKLSNGVFVSYKNENENVKIHCATRLLPHNMFTDYLDSVESKPYAVFDDKIDSISVINHDVKNETIKLNDSFLFVDTPKILMLDSHPADDYSYDLSHYNAVIIKAYHSGTINTNSPAFTSFCKRAGEQSVPIFLVNCLSGNIYESACAFDKLGIITLPNYSPITAYTKIWIAISTGLDIVGFMK